MSGPTIRVTAAGLGESITAPFFDENGLLHVVDSATGDILSVEMSSGTAAPISNTGGAPSGAAVSATGDMFVADIGHAAVMVASGEGAR